MIEFVINHKINAKTEGLNAIYAGMHWSKRKRLADDWRWIVKDAINKSGIDQKIFDVPVSIEMYFNSRMDCSNHALLVKLIEDGLKGVLIADDGPKYVKQIIITLFDGDGILVKIKEAE